MNSKTIIGIGTLVRDVLYFLDKNSGKKYYLGSRGGGALWNAIANASARGASVKAICVGGSDEGAVEAINDLKMAGVEILFSKFVSGKKTRTLHEFLDARSIRYRHPIHSYAVRCPVCGNETYRKDAASFTKRYVEESLRHIAKIGTNKLIVHIDGLDKSRIGLMTNLKKNGALLSLDLGRSTGLHRMHQQSVIDKLSIIDYLFVNSKVVDELLKITGSANLTDLVRKISANCIVVTKGERGVEYYGTLNGELQSLEQAASNSDNLIDTAGAGDAFIGQFLALISKMELDESGNLPDDPKRILDILRESQDWASYKCKYASARGHLAGVRGNEWTWENTKGLLKGATEVDELKVINLQRKTCYSCQKTIFSSTQDSIDTLRYRANVLRLPKKMKISWNSRYASNWNVLKDLRGTGYLVGTGGSFVVANFISILLTEKLNTPIMAVRPFDYIRIGVKTDWVIFVSGSGKTPDIISAINYSKHVGSTRMILITGAHPTELTTDLHKQGLEVLYTNANGERGFLSVAGISIPCFLTFSVFSGALFNESEGNMEFDRLYQKATDKVVKVFSEVEHRLPKELKGRNILILGGGYAWPSVLNLESKLTESGIGNPEISEIKDYSHGRFVSSIGIMALVIVCGMPDDQQYREFMLGKFPKKREPVIELVSDKNGAEGALELVLQAEHLMRKISEKEGLDISKPRIPRRGLDLYRYADIFNFKTSDCTKEKGKKLE